METLKRIFIDYKDFWLILIGWIANELFSSTRKKILKVFRLWKLRRQLKKIKNDDLTFLTLDNAIPYYAKDNIKLRVISKNFFISIPQPYQHQLSLHEFNSREDASLNSSRFSGIFADGNIPENFEAIVEDCAIETAQQFLAELEAGHIRFNGPMYGVYKISPQRLTIKEDAGLGIDFYTTDYFTYRTIGKIVEKIQKSNGQFIKLSGITDLNLINELLPSFGLACFAILNRGYGDEILFGKRSNNVVVDRGKWHFSVNEAFSLNDVDKYGELSFSACLYRGIREELGLSERFEKNIGEHEFLDLNIITDRLEPGILAFVRIKLNQKLTYQMLLDCYKTAQDRTLETSTITSIRIAELETFLTNNYDNISIGCRCGLRSLLARYRAGYLRED